MKKKYTKPTLVKVDLNHEQAVLGTCSATTTNLRNAPTGTLCTGSCKSKNSGSADSAAAS